MGVIRTDNTKTLINALDRIADLEKQNRELQEKLKYRNCVDCSNHSSKLRMRNLELEKRFSEAKEIIRELIGCLQQDTNEPETNYYVVKYIEKAEAFLKE